MTITRQRYFVKLKNKPLKVPPVREMDVRLGSLLRDAAPPSFKPQAQQSWRNELKSGAALLGLTMLVGAGLYAYEPERPGDAARTTLVQSGMPSSSGRVSRAAPTDESFIATFGAQRRTLQAKAAVPQQKQRGNLSGSCDVGGKGARDILRDVADCLKQHGGGNI